MKNKTINKIIDALIDQDLEDADFEKARKTCDKIEQAVTRARKYMDKMDEIADSGE